MVHDTVERIILDQVGTAGLGEMTDKHGDQLFEAIQATEADGNWLLRNDEILAQ